MKTSEFIEKINGLKMLATYGPRKRELFVKIGFDDTVATVSLAESCGFNTCYFGFAKLDSKSKKDLLLLLTEYVLTPIEEREETKRYKLKHRWVKGCINYYSKGDELFFAGPNETNAYKTAFSIEEWEKITNRKWERLLDEFEEELEVG